MPPTIPLANILQPAAAFCKRLLSVKQQGAKFAVGLDVGSASVKIVVLGPSKGTEPRPTVGQAQVPLEPGQEADPSDAIKNAVDTVQLPTRTVNVSVSGPWVIMRVVEMPIMRSAELKQALPFEAQRYLPFSIRDVVVDGAALGSIDASKMWVLIVACKKELIVRRMDWLKRAGLEAALIDVDALALSNGLLASVNGARSEGTRSMINVGAQLTNLVIFQGDTPYLVRDIPWGAEKLIRSVAEQTGAEEAAVSQELLQGASNPALQSAMRLAAESLVTELQLSFDYFENRFGQPPDEVLVSGGLGECAGFREALKSHLTQTMTPWAPVPGLSGQFAVAYGLALRSS